MYLYGLHYNLIHILYAIAIKLGYSTFPFHTFLSSMCSETLYSSFLITWKFIHKYRHYHLAVPWNTGGNLYSFYFWMSICFINMLKMNFSQLHAFYNFVENKSSICWIYFWTWLSVPLASLFLCQDHSIYCCFYTTVKFT